MSFFKIISAIIVKNHYLSFHRRELLEKRLIGSSSPKDFSIILSIYNIITLQTKQKGRCMHIVTQSSGNTNRDDIQSLFSLSENRARVNKKEDKMTNRTNDPKWLKDNRYARDAVEPAKVNPITVDPNDDREALIERVRDLIEGKWPEMVCYWHPHQGDEERQHEWESIETWDVAEVAIESVLASRATVPDAATETLQAELDEMAGRFSEYLCEATGGLLSKTGHDVGTMVSYTEEYYHNLHADARIEVRAERDAAVAAVERTRALVISMTEMFKHNHAMPVADLNEILAALDGAPEPEPEEEMYQAGCGSWDCRAPECGRA